MASGGSLTVTGSTISGNSASSFGGGIVASSAPLTVDHSTISGNAASSSAGGIWVYLATAEIDSSTLNDPIGGGLVNGTSTIHLNKTTVDGVYYLNQDYP